MKSKIKMNRDNKIKSTVNGLDKHELCIHKRTQQGTTTVFYLLFI